MKRVERKALAGRERIRGRSIRKTEEKGKIKRESIRKTKEELIESTVLCFL